MLRRVQCAFSRFSWLVVVPVALVSMACGGASDGDLVSSPTATVVADETASVDVLSASAKKPKKDKSVVCHTESDLEVSPGAVSGHLVHGDSLGSCSAPETCPCFGAADIQAAAAECTATVTSTCSAGDPYYLFLSCAPGGSVPPGFLGLYLSQTAENGYCQRFDVLGTFEQTGLTAGEYQACRDAIDASGFCF